MSEWSCAVFNLYVEEIIFDYLNNSFVDYFSYYYYLLIRY
jgi:hypothetical protein